MQHPLYRLASICLCAFITLVAPAQTPASSPDDFHFRPERQVLVYENGHTVTQEGAWRDSSALRAYAGAHPALAGGNFVLFQDANGPIRQLTDRASLAQLQATYAPMRALNAQQSALAEQQKPLGLEQKELAIQMRAAGTPAQMAEIGQQQGRLGHEQGKIGNQQGIIGRQQGIIGRAFYAQLQSILDACLRANTCPVVDPAHTS